jgi:hypothetical protein
MPPCSTHCDLQGAAGIATNWLSGRMAAPLDSVH